MKRSMYAVCLALLAVMLGLFSCADEISMPGGEVKEGKLTQVSLSFGVEGMEEVTSRALTDEQEFFMSDFYLLIFDTQGNCTLNRYFPKDELSGHSDGNSLNPTHGKVTVQVTSGPCYIYGIANVKANEMEDLQPKLDAVTTLEELKRLEASLATFGHIQRNQASLVMSGVFEGRTSPGKEPGYCVIPDQGGALQGRILLRRLDARIQFQLVVDNPDILSFTPKSWQVFHVPNKSLLIEDKDLDDAVGNTPEDYTNSRKAVVFSRDNQGNYFFEFYMLENLKKALNQPLTYADRERERKDPVTDAKPGQTVTNSGVYENVEPYATYVEIKADMTMNLPKEKLSKRFADVRYVVHLGYANQDAADFKSKRNTRYTYQMRVKGVENIILEVTEGREPQPGAEGDIIDAQEQVFNLDCHYHTFVLGFTYNQMKQFQFQVRTPFTSYTQANAVDDTAVKGECDWLEFKRNTENAAAYLEPHKGALLNLFTLAADVKQQYDGERGFKDPDKVYYYTAFVKEYTYDEAPAGRNWKKPYWQYYVNQPNRYAMLIYTPKYSADGESSYAKARYLISQRSIQTYYSTHSFNRTQTALGVEHINETGDPSSAGQALDWSPSNGYYNTYLYLQRNGYAGFSWSSYVQMNRKGQYVADPKHQVVSMKNEVLAWAECMARNRDENGDGRIDGSELKWYLPTVNQMSSIYLGAHSLSTPLFDANKISSISDNTWYHYFSSDNKKLWAEEGCSFGARGGERELRCVRNLGREDRVASLEDAKKHQIDPPYRYQDNRFDMAYLNENSIRTGIVHTGELAVHQNFSETNQPYKHFQVAKHFVTKKNAQGKWADYVTEKQGVAVSTVCSEYYENPDGSDKGTWRLPNQRELMLMRLAHTDYQSEIFYESDQYGRPNDAGNGFGAYSLTFWKYNPKRHFGWNATNNVMYLDSGYSYGGSTVRCVRDRE